MGGGEGARGSDKDGEIGGERRRGRIRASGREGARRTQRGRRGPCLEASGFFVKGFFLYQRRAFSRVLLFPFQTRNKFWKLSSRMDRIAHKGRL